MKAMNITSNLSNLENMLSKPLSLRNRHSISLRRRYIARSYSEAKDGWGWMAQQEEVEIERELARS